MSGTPGGDDDDGSGTPSSGPIVQSFSVSPTSMMPNDMLTFSAVVTDTGGVAMLTGATLVDPDTGVTYGSFGTPGGQGTFELVVAWKQLIQVKAVTDATNRKFTAHFFDQGGSETTKSITVAIVCGPTNVACQADSECGCDQQCDIGVGGANGRCCVPPGGECSTDADCCVSPTGPGYPGYRCGADHACHGQGWLSQGQWCAHPYDCDLPGATCPGPCP